MIVDGQNFRIHQNYQKTCRSVVPNILYRKSAKLYRLALPAP